MMAPAPTGRVAPSAAHPRHDDEAVVFWSARMPGHRVLVWYSDDDVWHERLLLWPSRDITGRRTRDRWVICTPDRDVYEEDLDQHHDVVYVVRLADDGSRPYLAEDIYAFHTPYSDVDLVELFREGRSVSLAEAADSGATVARNLPKFNS